MSWDVPPTILAGLIRGTGDDPWNAATKAKSRPSTSPLMVFRCFPKENKYSIKAPISSLYDSSPTKTSHFTNGQFAQAVALIRKHFLWANISIVKQVQVLAPTNIALQCTFANRLYCLLLASSVMEERLVPV